MQYSKANTDDDFESRESLLSDEGSPLYQLEKNAKKWRRVLLISLYLLGTALACLAAGLAGYYWHRDLDGICTSHTSESSPLVNKVSYHEQRFNGSFLKENAFRQDAGPETDAAWASIGADFRAVRISPEEARDIGMPKDFVKISEKHGGGYPVHVEGFHHLHCLNLLRQTNYYNYEHYRDLGQGAFKNDEFIVKRHVSVAHCLDIIRQQLMCTTDIGVFGQFWIYPHHPEPFVDFNTQHKCRNFEQLRQWTEKNQLPEKVPSDFLEPPKVGDRIYPEVP
ncbi:oxidase ustYa family protein [Aspergillus glaucus CBS 516.65]|uniref:Tat pathway signal sequence n=1 Tax=Aspergillus glaucus CBS 516.65 TaxID=1160497 RepID=A0A1L9VQV4_ASPGL|nr:hypothetical protein ASPGLDRAFT_81100 [Aspergillus glaucus CBS 516.65]OJJ86271.1 hypothetical protein ASPGLDRAFT_81100 [Aspergillus glaucus CBS 516.65]